MKLVDIAFGATLVVFVLGSLAGVFVTIVSPTFRWFLLLLITSRIIAPVRATSVFGRVAVMLLIFLNNCIPVVLSFVYPLIIGKVNWTPPMTEVVRRRLLMAFSLLTAGLLGFFNLGATLTLLATLKGASAVTALLATSWLHAPLEFFFVLTCVAEPLRLALQHVHADEIDRLLGTDVRILVICLLGLLASATIEVFAAV
jgi:hypothetical protein